MQYGFKQPNKSIVFKEVDEITLELVQGEIEGMVEVLTDPFGNDPELQMYMNEEALIAEESSIFNISFTNFKLGYNLIPIYGNIVFLRLKAGSSEPEGLSECQIRMLREMRELNESYGVV